PSTTPFRSPSRHLRLDEGARRAQHDEVLEGETVFAPRSALGRDEPHVDQSTDGAARQAQDSLHVPHAVGMRHRPVAARYRRLALRADLSACSTRLGPLRGPSRAVEALPSSVFCRLARNASMRSMTLPPVSGAASETEISWPSTFC